jgi:hypothetical protein
MARTIGVKSIVRRVALVVEDLEAGILGVFARAFAGILSEFGVRVGQRDRLRLGILRFGHLEEAARESWLRGRPVGDHGEVLVVLELVVDAGAEQADEQFLARHGDRHGGGNLRRGIAADDQIDLVDIEKLGIDRGHLGRLALVVVIDELHRPPEQAALRVDVGLPDLHGDKRHLAVGGERTGATCQARS